MNIFKKTLKLSIFFFLLAFNVQAQSTDELITSFGQVKDVNTKIRLAKQIGMAYQQQKGYTKATEYYQKALELEKYNGAPLSQQGETLKDIGFTQMLAQDYTKAKATYEKVLEVEKQDKNAFEVKETLEALADICTISKDYTGAIKYYEQLAVLYKDDLSAQANTYNNIGFNYKKLKNNQKALENFDKSIKINQQIAQKNAGNSDKRGIALTNIGSTYTNEGDFKSAKKYFSDALAIARSKNNKVEEAKITNFLAVNEFLAGNNENAISYLDDAIRDAESQLNTPNKAKAQEVLMASYQIKANIYQQQQDMKEYQRNNQKYLDLQKASQEEQTRQRQEVMEKQLDIEKKENELKSNLAEQDKQKMELAQTKLQAEKTQKENLLKESEISRLRSGRELQEQKIRNASIEKQRAQQQLELVLQKSGAEKQQQQIAFLEKDKELENQKRGAERQEEQQKRELLEKEKKIQEIKAEDEARFNSYLKWGGIIVATLLSIVIASIAFALMQNKKKNEQLARRNEEIEKQSTAILKQSEEIQIQSQAIALKNDEIVIKNQDLERSAIEINEKNAELQAQSEELQQNQEEILAQRDFIERKNEELSMQNENIAQSINVARTIQNAILPYKRQMDGLLGEHFIIYRPRNVVSGDFYWMGVIGRKVFVAAVDCTGHGVPGAFMSLIGKTLLDKMIDMYKMVSPAEILERMHWEIGNFLHQKESDNKDGMDVALCMLEQENDHTIVTFSGAKRPLYYSENESNQVFILKGDRKAIGGDQNDVVKFTNQVVKLKKGSAIYLSSDGFIDQNDADRVKLGESKLKYTISSCTLKPMAEQEKIFSDLLDRHQTGTEQRDDILFLGIRL